MANNDYAELIANVEDAFDDLDPELIELDPSLIEFDVDLAVGDDRHSAIKAPSPHAFLFRPERYFTQYNDLGRAMINLAQAKQY